MENQKLITRDNPPLEETIANGRLIGYSMEMFFHIVSECDNKEQSAWKLVEKIIGRKLNLIEMGILYEELCSIEFKK
jgi:hypothetical protein